VPGGGISPDNSRWIPCRKYRKSFFLPVKVLRAFFRKRFLIHLRRAYRKGKLQFHGELEPLAQPAAFEALCQKAGRLKWVVYAKRPFGGPEQVLKYLARYTHRVAISNHRLTSMDDHSVAFRWKDYADGSTPKTMTLDGVEFVRRFLQHVLPSGFVRIRHFGFLANRCREDKLARCREFLKQPPSSSTTPLDEKALESCTTVAEGDSEPDKVIESPRYCPACGVGRMRIVELIPRPTPLRPVCATAGANTS
jgi:hypothetical protein